MFNSLLNSSSSFTPLPSSLVVRSRTELWNCAIRSQIDYRKKKRSALVAATHRATRPASAKSSLASCLPPALARLERATTINNKSAHPELEPSEASHAKTKPKNKRSLAQPKIYCILSKSRVHLRRLVSESWGASAAI